MTTFSAPDKTRRQPERWQRKAMEVIKHVAPSLLALAVLAGLDQSGLMESTDLLFYDLMVTNFPTPPGSTLPITIIGISERDINRFGWPIDDRLFCQAIDQLMAAKVAVIGFDIYRDRGVGLEQECLRKQFRENSRLISIFNEAEGIGPVPGTPPGRQAYNDVSIDRDGVLRRDLVHVLGQDEAIVALPLRMYEIGTGDKALRQRLNLEQVSDAWLDRSSGGYRREEEASHGLQRLLRFRPPGSFNTWTLDQLLHGTIPQAELNGQLVLIGSTAPTLKDLFVVPYSRFSRQAQLLRIPGVEIHALRLATLLERQRRVSNIGFVMPEQGNLCLVVAMCCIGLLAGEWVSPLKRSVALVALLATLATTTLTGLFLVNIWIGGSLAVAGLILFAGAAWIRQGSASYERQQQFQRLLGQSASPQVAQQLWEKRDELLLEGRFKGQVCDVTVMMADLADFTSVAEVLSPSELLDWLNRALVPCVSAISQRGGIVNKFTGDGFLAVFGVPLSQGPQRDAQEAVAAAVAIYQGIDSLNAELKATSMPTMRMRIGIHSGPVLAGSIGGNERLEYAVIGDTVNCASRLESMEKQRHHGAIRILISAATQSLLSGVPEGFTYSDWGRVAVKGRSEPLQITELRIHTEPV